MSSAPIDVKELIAARENRIHLDDVVTAKLRAVLEALSKDDFSPSQPCTKESIASRIQAYDSVVSEIQVIAALVARWGDAEDAPLLLEKIVGRMADQANAQSAGMAWWLRLRWYPVSVLLYSCGITALSARRYEMLTPLTMPVATSGGTFLPLSIVVASNMMASLDAWHQIPEHDRQYTPHSEHLFALMKRLDDVLFLGASYERLFDDFELLNAIYVTHASGGLGAIGRFGYKHNRNELVERLVNEAKAAGPDWGPLKGKLFDGSADSFVRAAEDFTKQLVRVQWH